MTTASAHDGVGSSDETRPKITIARGDGIGPEIMDATLQLLEAADAHLDIDEIQIGYRVYQQGNPTGIAEGGLDMLRKNRIFLKAPITTPQGGGNKSVTVTIRKTLGLFANVRPSRAYMPFVQSHFPEMDLVVIRENEEDLYAGIEHRQTTEVVQNLKLISRPGSERVIRYAFEYARQYGRKRVTCMTKDNIMKQTDGLFHQVFDEVAREYPDLQSDHYIVDIGAALLADQPGRFDVVVTLNLYGDILTDITSQVSGSVGLGGSSNIGDQYAMFEAVHGSAPDIAGKDIANPSGLMNAACLMMADLGQPLIAQRMQNALLRTLEDGIHTADLYTSTYTTSKVGTRAFTRAVIERLGSSPQTLSPFNFGTRARPIRVQVSPVPIAHKRLVGVDVFLDWGHTERNPEALGNTLRQLGGALLELTTIANRGIKVYPDPTPGMTYSDHWQCRFLIAGYEESDSDLQLVPKKAITQLLERIESCGLDFIKIENLYEFDGKRAFSATQGE
jgi:isocitrate dehydrogenase